MWAWLTEKCIPDSFFLTSNMHKIHFWPGPHREVYSSNPLVTWGGILGTPLQRLLLPLTQHFKIPSTATEQNK